MKVLNSAVLENLSKCNELCNSAALRNSKEVQEFRKELQAQGSLEEDEEESDTAENEVIRKVFRKKISKKGTNDRKTLTYKGEKYEIDKWVQCDGCNKWRRTHK